MLETIPQIWAEALAGYGRKPPFMVKRSGAYVPIDAVTAEAAVRELSLGFVSLGVAPGTKVAIISETRLEWTLIDLAILCAGGADVTVYPTLLPAQIEYILRDSDTQLVVASTAEQLAKIAAIRSNLSLVRHVVGIDASPDDPQGLTLADVRTRGAAGDPARHRSLAAAVRPGDLASIIYTSGTTGEPKGAMLTHRNLASDVEAASEVLPSEPDDRALSFLPLSHCYERSATYYYLRNHVTIAYAESLETVAANLREVRPTVTTVVPRVLEKLYARIQESFARAHPLAQRLSRWAIGVARTRARALREGRPAPLGTRLRYAIADWLVCRKIRERLGGRLRHVVSGSAPLAPELAEFFTAIGIPVLEGYGLTETAPTLAVNPPDRPRIGTVGRPLPGVEVRIASDGEILVRGPMVMTGYYKREQATREAVSDGWFHTGDIGHLDEEGYLVITDRKKDLIVTAGGKKIAPQMIENRLVMQDLVSQAIVIGNRRPFAVALIVPDFGVLARWSAANGLAPRPAEQLITDAAVVRRFQTLIDEINEDLAKFERIKKWVLLPREFSLQAGELTPTQKIKRATIETAYRDVIERMYAEPAQV